MLSRHNNRSGLPGFFISDEKEYSSLDRRCTLETRSIITANIQKKDKAGNHQSIPDKHWGVWQVLGDERVHRRLTCKFPVI